MHHTEVRRSRSTTHHLNSRTIAGRRHPTGPRPAARRQDTNTLPYEHKIGHTPPPDYLRTYRWRIGDPVHNRYPAHIRVERVRKRRLRRPHRLRNPLRNDIRATLPDMFRRYKPHRRHNCHRFDILAALLSIFHLRKSARRHSRHRHCTRAEHQRNCPLRTFGQHRNPCLAGIPVVSLHTDHLRRSDPARTLRHRDISRG